MSEERVVGAAGNIRERIGREDELLEALEYVCAEINNRASPATLLRAAGLAETVMAKVEGPRR